MKTIENTKSAPKADKAPKSAPKSAPKADKAPKSAPKLVPAFKARLNKVLKSFGTQQDKLQELLDETFKTFVESKNSDTTNLNLLFTSILEIKGINNSKLLAYIKETIQVTFNIKKGTFRKIKSESKKVNNTGKWYNFDAKTKKPNSKPEFSLDSSIERLIARAESNKIASSNKTLLALKALIK